jgi:hypothetical protein
MKKKAKKRKVRKAIIIAVSTIFGLGILIYIAFSVMMYYTFTVGCGMDDGPFVAVLSTK